MAARRMICINNFQLAMGPIFRDRTNPLDIFDNLQLLERYRFTREAILEITARISEKLNKQKGNCTLIPVLQASYFHTENLFMLQITLYLNIFFAPPYWFTCMGCKWRRVKVELFQGKHIFFVQATGACQI